MDAPRQPCPSASGSVGTGAGTEGSWVARRTEAHLHDRPVDLLRLCHELIENSLDQWWRLQIISLNEVWIKQKIRYLPACCGGEGNGTPLQYSCLENPMDEGPGGLQSMGSLGVGHDWATSLSLFTCMHWRRKWQPTPVFLPGESRGRGSLVGCCLWDRTESNTTEVT